MYYLLTTVFTDSRKKHPCLRTFSYRLDVCCFLIINLINYY
ncbi:hypothetical protein A1OE_1002 [Candidatus Endolissoclinum faulkneri L2]|uniref:Uncharacterized protein n=1 Tax=Candidatus Endolissoclinum faulkneri L2 TaxID=1193729 RepID=K7Z554_9PROT|nr:hypothetical protein A1OE_1002 [Candidatus Endolissoclinum faulkneri L2]